MNQQFPIPDSRMVLWYNRGAVNHEPGIALVTHIGSAGVVDLTIFPRGENRILCANAVRHKDDPFLKQYPQILQESGCWDYLPASPRDEFASTDKEPTGRKYKS